MTTSRRPTTQRERSRQPAQGFKKEPQAEGEEEGVLGSSGPPGGEHLLWGLVALSFVQGRNGLTHVGGVADELDVGERVPAVTAAEVAVVRARPLAAAVLGHD